MLHILYLHLNLLPRHLLGIVDEQSDDLCIVDVALPELLRQVMVPADLFAQLTQDCQTDPEAIELVVWRAGALPVLYAPLVLIGLEEDHHLGRVHDQHPPVLNRRG